MEMEMEMMILSSPRIGMETELTSPVPTTLAPKNRMTPSGYRLRQSTWKMSLTNTTIAIAMPEVHTTQTTTMKATTKML